MKTEEQMVSDVLEAQKKIDDLTRQIKSVQSTLTEAEQVLLGHREQNDRPLFVNDVLQVKVEKKDIISFRINAEKKEEAFTFIDEECGRADAIKIKKEVHWKTLESIITKCIQEGIKYPEDAINSNNYSKLKIEHLK